MCVFCLLYVKEAEMVILLHLQSEVMIQADKIMREGKRKEGEGGEVVCVFIEESIGET